MANAYGGSRTDRHAGRERHGRHQLAAGARTSPVPDDEHLDWQPGNWMIVTSTTTTTGFSAAPQAEPRACSSPMVRGRSAGSNLSRCGAFASGSTYVRGRRHRHRPRHHDHAVPPGDHQAERHGDGQEIIQVSKAPITRASSATPASTSSTHRQTRRRGRSPSRERIGPVSGLEPC